MDYLAISFNCLYEHLDDSDCLDKSLSYLFVAAIVLEISHSHVGIPWLQIWTRLVPGNTGTNACVAEHWSFLWT